MNYDNDDDQNNDCHGKSNDRSQRRPHKRARLERIDNDTDDRLDSRLIDEGNPNVESVRQDTPKRSKLSSDHEQPPLPKKDFTARITRNPGSEFEPTSNDRISTLMPTASCGDGSDQHCCTTEEGGLGPTYNVEDARQYLQAYMTYAYPLCPLEICNESVEELVLNTLLRKTTSGTPTTILCVCSMLALGEFLYPSVFISYRVSSSLLSLPPFRKNRGEVLAAL